MFSMHITGIDPGIMDTGVVHMSFYLGPRIVEISPLVVHGVEDIDNLNYLGGWVKALPTSDIYIEKFNPRPGMRTTGRMLEIERMLKDVLPKPTLVNNTGVKQIITRELMELLDVWRFPKATHHQDLRSAARIGLFGAVKQDHSNAVLGQLVRDQINGQPWTVKLEEVVSYGP